MKIDDFRRNNVDLLVKQVHDTIKSINVNMPFGISPFGIWATTSVMPQLGTNTNRYIFIFSFVCRFKIMGCKPLGGLYLPANLLGL